MKGISVLLFCVFISYTFSDKQYVAPFHQRIGDYVSLSNVTDSDKIKRAAITCSRDACSLHTVPPMPPCCAGLTCICIFSFICQCSSQTMIHVTNTGILQTVIVFLSFVVNLPSY
ncbi:uncharacterized protein LOC128250514 [Octopus bimaculoides]|uniref:uncharacterized protein LOC128250514 n=1 Tax=Octopus bimaculoides TaxID=37653 RepID=UPI0022E46FBE|nr:uncharacterized protein LOC128250514 [Octopus bimaculoides]